MASTNQSHCEERSSSVESDIAPITIGTQFKTRGRHPRLCTVTDVLSTFNSKGELVKVLFVAEHAGPFGQKVVERDVCRTTILMGRVS
jgi:hypothetical protein